MITCLLLAICTEYGSAGVIMSLLKARVLKGVTIVKGIKGLPMVDSVGICSKWFNMVFPCTLRDDGFIDYTSIQSPCNRLIAMETSLGPIFGARKTKNLFHDYMFATGELYREYSYELI